MLHLGENLRGISAESVQFVTVPWTTYTGNAQWVDRRRRRPPGTSNWVQWVQPQANKLFTAIAHDDQAAQGAKKRAASSPSARRIVKVQVLNGTNSRCGSATSTAASLRARGFHVIGQAADAQNPNYTSTVIEYAGAAELPAAQTLARPVQQGHAGAGRGPDERHDASDPGLDFHLAQVRHGEFRRSRISPATYDGITANVNICSDSSAFSG